MERIALAIWRNRISPLFDVAKRLMIVDIDNRVPRGDDEDLLFGNGLAGKVSRLCNLNVDTLICGAISKELSYLLTSHGIQVIAFIAGDKDDVLSAYLQNGWVPSCFSMPGCGGVRMQRREPSGRKMQPAFRPDRKAGNSKGARNGKTRHRWTPGR